MGWWQCHLFVCVDHKGNRNLYCFVERRSRPWWIWNSRPSTYTDSIMLPVQSTTYFASSYCEYNLRNEPMRVLRIRGRGRRLERWRGRLQVFENSSPKAVTLPHFGQGCSQKKSLWSPSCHSGIPVCSVVSRCLQLYGSHMNVISKMDW